MPENNKTTVIKSGRFIDGLGGPAKAEQAIIISDGRIRSMVDLEALQKETPPDAEIIDFTDYCIVPGLIDSHTHLSLAGDGRSYGEMFSDTDEMMVLTGAMNMRRHLSAGITTIREHGARNRVGFTLKEGLKRGYVSGPRMLVSGRPITCTGGHFHGCNEIADGETEIRRSVRRLVHEGADYIKIMASGGSTRGTFPGKASYSTEELHAAVHEAHHFRRLTVAHCRAKESMVRAIEAGIDLIEHAEFLDPDEKWRFDPKIAEMMAESKIWISPTLQTSIRYPKILSLRAKRDSGSILEDETDELNMLEKRARLRLDIVRKMLDFGLLERIVPGTDSGVASIPFGHLDYDLQLLVEVGFTPEQALASATRVSAEAIGQIDKLGTLGPGKSADFVVLDGDPTVDISAVSRVVAVFMGGNRYK
jgi:imidazolonepropionase-like amidohydrolase